jgi:hypothetical protein
VLHGGYRTKGNQGGDERILYKVLTLFSVHHLLDLDEQAEKNNGCVVLLDAGIIGAGIISREALLRRGRS